MKIDPVFLSGAWWIDTDQASELLRVSPETLKRHRQTVKFASLDSSSGITCVFSAWMTSFVSARLCSTSPDDILSVRRVAFV